MALTTVKNAGLAGSIDLTAKVTGTLPATNGGTGSTTFSPGKVLQVIEGDVTTHTTITSTSYVDVSLEATITPSATSSKVLILVNCNNIKINSSSGGNAQMRIQHDQGGGSFTNVAEYEGILGYNDNDVNNPSPMYLHSPSTTSATKYKVQFAQLTGFSSGSFRFNNRSSDGGYIRSSIILMEISA